MSKVTISATDTSAPDSHGRKLWTSEWTDADGTKHGQLSFVPKADLIAYWRKRGRTVVEGAPSTRKPRNRRGTR